MTLTRCTAVKARRATRRNRRDASERARRTMRDESEQEESELEEARREREEGQGWWCGWRWKTCQLSYSSPEFFVLQSARTKKEILFRFHRVPFRPLPPLTSRPISPHPLTFVLALTLALSLPFSLIGSSNFRLHSPSACLLCRPVRIQRTLCRNLGTRIR